LNLKQVSAITVLAACLPGRFRGQSTQEISLDSLENLDLRNLKAEVVTYRGHTAVRVANTGPQDSEYGDGLAVVRRTSFQDGTIEVILSGDTAPNAPPELRGFVGIAFRVKDASHFECFYIRPKNGRSQDQLQRNHSTQYISIPGFPWDKLRRETPGKYESYVDLIPGDWTKVKMEVIGKVARLYVNAAERPTLIINDLKQPVSSGAIALWVGQGTIAHFADLRITKALRESASASSANAHPTPDRAPDVGHAPKLVNTCLITKNVKRLVEFYERILELKANKSGEDYAEFPTDVGVLAIFSANAQEKYIPSSAEATVNGSVILEFRVADVDQQYRRLQGLVKTWVKPPTTQPWGTRSIYFRDPDGNLVDFYAPAKAPPGTH